MNDLLIPALGVISDAFAAYDPMPFGLEEATFIDYASSQFQKRIDRIERARGASLDEIYRVAHLALENEDETAP
jgi:ribonucleoside-diphosphate reductase beta chain